MFRALTKAENQKTAQLAAQSRVFCFLKTKENVKKY